LSSFSSRARSDTTILVKNIPYGTTAEQIREMFEQHGKLSRVLVPPAGTMALVDFVHPDEASAAFRATVYRRLGNSIIYLEKGPLGMFEDNSADNVQPTTSTAFKPVVIAEQQQTGEDDGNAAPPLAAGSTLFVKNLSFATTSERLAQGFRHLPSFAFARVQTKPDPRRVGANTGTSVDAPRLSLGYGFIGFKTVDAAKKAMKSIQGYVLDGHSLHVNFAGRGTEDDESDKDKKAALGKARTTKMIVKNVPFEATKKDIRELFRCGDLFPLVPRSRLVFFLHLWLTDVVNQRLRSCQIRSPPQEIRLSFTRVRLPGLFYSSRSGERIHDASAYPFIGQTSHT
jgi:multiple RNA-binding domain-containing protein 1